MLDKSFSPPIASAYFCMTAARAGSSGCAPAAPCTLATSSAANSRAGRAPGDRSFVNTLSSFVETARAVTAWIDFDLLIPHRAQSRGDIVVRRRQPRKLPERDLDACGSTEMAYPNDVVTQRAQVAFGQVDATQVVNFNRAAIGHA